MMTLSNCNIGLEELVFVGSNAGVEPTATLALRCRNDKTLVMKRKRKTTLKTSVPMKMTLLNNSLHKSKSRSSSSSSSKGFTIATGVIQNGVSEYVPVSTNSLQSVGLASQGTSGGSIGDSDIRKGNDKVWVDYQINTVNKVWNIVKFQLGVVGKENEVVYVEEIRKMEERDQDAQRLRETKNGAQ